MTRCPNLEHPDFKYLESNLGKQGAYKVWMQYGEDLPDRNILEKIVAQRDPIKEFLKYYNADVQGFLPKTVLIEAVRIDIKKKNLPLEVKQASNGRYYLAKNGKKVSFYALSGTDSRVDALDNKLKDILTNIGIRVEAYDTLKDKLGVDALGAADILNKVVYLKDNQSVSSLPEETAHFFIEGLGVDNPLVQRAISLVVSHPIYKEVLEEYRDIYTSEIDFKKEAVGKLLGKYIIQEYKTTEAGYSIWTKIRSTFDLIVDRVLKLFKKLDKTTILDETEKIYGDLAKEVLLGNISLPNTSNPTTYYSIGNLKTIKEQIDSKIKAINIRVDKYKALTKYYAGESLERMEEFVASTEKQIADIEALAELNQEDAFIKLLELVSKDIDDIESRLDSLNFAGTARAIEFIRAYRNIDLLDTEEAVIKKSSAEIENRRKILEAKLIKLSHAKLSKVLEKESTSGLTGEELLSPGKDMSFDQRWLGAMANADDALLALVDKIYKRDVVDATLEKQIEFKDTHESLLSKIDKGKLPLLIQKYKGKPTGRITSKWSAEYYEEKKRFAESVKDLDTDERRIQWATWFSMNHEPRMPGESYTDPLPMWIDPNWTKIQNDNSLKDYYDFVVHTKKRSDNLMGLDTFKNSEYRLPYFHRDFIESVEQEGIVGAFKGLGKDFVEALEYTRLTDKVIIDESGREVRVPIKQGVGTGDNFSTDIVSIITNYHNAATLHQAKREIQGLVELAKIYAEVRTLPKTNWKGKVLDQNKDLVTIDGAGSAAFKRFEDWYAMVFIGDKSKDQGAYKIFGKEIDKQKIAKAFTKYNSLTALALNIFSSTANLIYGGAMQVIEAVGGEYYSSKDYLWATKEYSTNALSDKLKLMNKYFRVLQDTTEFEGRKKIPKWLNVFIGTEVGEHMLQSRIFLAMAHNYKVTDTTGKQYNLWDAYEVVEGKLKLKEGITLSKEEISNFRRKVEGVNQRLHGRYTDLDMAAIQQGALGNLAMQFRKWVHPGYEARFRAPYFDERLQQEIKGRYRSYSDFFKSIKEMKNLAKGWNNLSSHDKANMKRNIAELVYMTGMVVLLSTLRSIGDDDLDDSKAFNFMMYQVDRFNTEMRFYNIGIVTGDLTKLIRTPAAALSTFENAGKLLNNTLQYPFRDEEENLVRNKDYTKVQRDIEKLIPLIKEVRRWSNIEDQANYFKTF